jgi:hypothetical protein
MAATTIVEATRSYERWLGAHTRIVRTDLNFKHAQMAADLFSFMRATYYRWAQVFPEICPELARAPALLGVGDLHVENFGTWRDAEGRLVWGVNDFDETHKVAYANDLVRLAVSARLAKRAGHLQITQKELCRSILDGYRKGIEGAGRPMVLAENDRWLRLKALGELRDPVNFWAKALDLPATRKVAPGARKLLDKVLPNGAEAVTYRTRRAGLGSLGHERFVVLAQWRGGAIAREAKAMVPPSSDWVHQRRSPERIHYQTILDRAVRCPDPILHVHEHWVVRRLAPDCSRIELASMPAKPDEVRLLRAMGLETANIHHGSPRVLAAVRADFANRPQGWLVSATRKMEKALAADWKVWRASRPPAA